MKVFQILFAFCSDRDCAFYFSMVSEALCDFFFVFQAPVRRVGVSVSALGRESAELDLLLKHAGLLWTCSVLG